MAKVYVVPFALYLVGTSMAGRYDGSSYAIAYAIIALVVLAATLFLLRDQVGEGKIIQPHLKITEGVFVGVLGIVLWIVLAKLHLEGMLAAYLPEFLQPGERVGFNPFDELDSKQAVWSFIAVRLLGIAILVPIAEELFWRGFLLRWLIDPEWEKVKIGEYSLHSCAIVTLMFTVAHPEWLAAAIYCLLINALLYWKKDLWQCIVAHAVSNFVLAVYVLNTNEWWLW